MDSLSLKLVLTPTLIGGASLAGRRWGPAVSGWVVGVPFTSGPIALFLALNQGVAFARAAVVGTLAGTISQVGFCLTYGWLAGRFGWPLTVAISILVFGGLTAVLQYLPLCSGPVFVAAILAVLLALWLLPARAHDGPRALAPLPRWDLPARMGVATGFVLLLTAWAPALGPRLTGLLAPFPLYAAVLAVFAHAIQGPAPAALVLKGSLLGLFTFAGFFFTLATLLERAGIAVAFGSAILAACVLQGSSLWWLRRTS